MRSLATRNGFLALAIIVLTAVAWGGRVGLLTGGEDYWAWARIGGSIVIGVAAALALLVPGLVRARKPVLLSFSVWTVLLWGRSLVINWLGSGSIAFKLVHTVLALGFFFLALWATAAATRGDLVSSPDEADGEEQRQSKASGIS